MIDLCVIDLLLPLRLLFSATAIYFLHRTWRLCKHNGLLLLAAQQVTVTVARLLMVFAVVERSSLIYTVLLVFTSVFSALGAYLIYADFNKAYQEGRYAAENSP